MVNSESVILKSEKSTYQINNISTCIILLLSIDAIYRIYPSSIVDICLLSLADWITGHRHGDFICIYSYYISNQLNYFFQTVRKINTFMRTNRRRIMANGAGVKSCSMPNGATKTTNLQQCLRALHRAWRSSRGLNVGTFVKPEECKYTENQELSGCQLCRRWRRQSWHPENSRFSM